MFLPMDTPHIFPRSSNTSPEPYNPYIDCIEHNSMHCIHNLYSNNLHNKIRDHCCGRHTYLYHNNRSTPHNRLLFSLYQNCTHDNIFFYLYTLESDGTPYVRYTPHDTQNHMLPCNHSGNNPSNNCSQFLMDTHMFHHHK